MATTPEVQAQISDAYYILIENIKNDLTHKYYVRVNELADKYRKLVTGENVESLLRQFSRREDADLFAQRVALTNLITPAVSAMIMNPFFRVGRTNNINKIIDFEKSEANDNKLAKVNTIIAEYNGQNSLSDYLDTRLVELNFVDPNAFIITEFEDVELGAQGEMTDLPKPKPREVSSKTVTNYKYENNILQWLICKTPIKYYDNKDKECDGYKWTIYYPDIAIEFTQVDLTGNTIRKGELVEYEVENETVKYFRVGDKTLYKVEEFEHKAGLVPAVRVGYKQDRMTNGKTMVSPMHDAMCYFMKSIKTVSEFDLTMSLHAFPQKFQYVNKCPGAGKHGCESGYTLEGAICQSCNGSGMPIHTSSQDAVVMRIPKDKEDMVNLESMVHYEYPPIDLLKFQDQFIFELKNEAKQAVFNSEIFVKASIEKTATEVDYSYESVYDTLFPYAKNYTFIYKYIAKVSAAYVDVKDLIIEYKFPKDFKFKTVDDLLNELKLANDSSAPGYIKQELSNDIAAQQYVDKPEELKRIIAKQKFYPFPDKNFAEISFIISSDLTTEYNKFLYANFDNIFLKLESDAEAKGLYFYDLAPNVQSALVAEAVTQLIIDSKATQTIAVGFNTPPNDITTGSEA